MQRPVGFKVFLPPLLLGGLSAALYATVSFAPAFLLPLQVAGAGKGFRVMLRASLVAAVSIAVLQLSLLAMVGSLGIATALAGISAPLALVAALLGMAHPRLARTPFVFRALAGGLLVSLAVLPAFMFVARDPGVRAMFVEATRGASTSLGIETLDPDELWASLSRVIAAGFGAILFLFLFGSAWGGTRIGLRWRIASTVAKIKKDDSGAMPAATDTTQATDSPPEIVITRPIDLSAIANLGIDEPALPPALSGYRVPPVLVWPFLASWAGILASRFVPVQALSAVAWNAAISLSICYGFQGFAVAGALAGRIGMATVARVLGPVFVVLVFLGGTTGLVAASLMALLGTLETWIPFRPSHQGE